MTHKELVNLAYKWVLGPGRCGVAMREMVAAINEIPDVIGFKGGCDSTVIECKTSRADFFRDRKKYHVMYPAFGMGARRYYCTPKDLVKIEELPEKWGLLEVNEKGKIRVKHNPYKWHSHTEEFSERNIRSEHKYMYSALRRLHINGHMESIYGASFLVQTEKE
jgi:hypothetical protein